MLVVLKLKIPLTAFRRENLRVLVLQFDALIIFWIRKVQQPDKLANFNFALLVK